MESKKLEMEAVTYIRGRSLPKMFIIVDEAQNLTPLKSKRLFPEQVTAQRSSSQAILHR